MPIIRVLDTQRGDVIVPLLIKAGAPVDGASGTYAGVAEKGWLLIDTVNGALYQNTGTKASPVWSGIEANAGALATLSVSGLATLQSVQLDTGTKTAAATAGAATLNKSGGVITTEALTTAAAAEYELTLTNSLIAATDQVFASVQNGSNTQGVPLITRVTPGASSVKIRVQNNHATEALNGTLKISFAVHKN